MNFCSVSEFPTQLNRGIAHVDRDTFRRRRFQCHHFIPTERNYLWRSALIGSGSFHADNGWRTRRLVELGLKVKGK